MVQSAESYTTSLASSITQYQHQHGRRLDIQYHALRLAFGDKPFFAPVDDSATAILDVGTGTGIWVLDVGTLYRIEMRNTEHDTDRRDVADIYPSPVVGEISFAPVMGAH
ncbi:MAG: hypothetical protein Q9191_007802 [Dirinaria sp. TL-2023a]